MDKTLIRWTMDKTLIRYIGFMRYFFQITETYSVFKSMEIMKQTRNCDQQK